MKGGGSGGTFASMMNAINRPGEITRLMMISSLTNIIGSIIFIYYFGIWGAAIAPVLTEILGAYIIRKKLLHTLEFDVLSLPRSIQFYWIYWINQYTIKPWKKFKYQS